VLPERMLVEPGLPESTERARPVPDADRTVLRPARSPPQDDRAERVTVEWEGPDGLSCARQFTTAFRIGRHSGCDICLPVDSVSRRHAEVYREGDSWWLQDLRSANGTLIDGRRTDRVRLAGRVTAQLGENGPRVTITVGTPSPGVGRDGTEDADDRTVLRPRGPAPVRVAPRISREPSSTVAGAASTGQAPDTPPPPLAQAAEPKKSFEDIVQLLSAKEREAADHAEKLHQAFRQYRKKGRRWQIAAFAILGLLLAVAVGVLIRQNEKVEQANALAVDLFYDIKTLEVELARLEDRVRSSKQLRLEKELDANRARLKHMLARYEKYVNQAESPEASLGPEDRLILKVARTFGECELNMPQEFKQEVKLYIQKWQATGRLARGIRTAVDNGYVPEIAEALREHDLPPQFLYLGLQESGFNARAVGPPTRWGAAKGPWQLIASTAMQYGLQVGPLKDIPEYDPDDQRFDFAAATEAAASFLRDLYKTDAQASGLLVMASYNWGPANIVSRIRQMPNNPRDRNFWKLLQSHTIPEETYDYVFYIFSAAVIGENPRLFGFDFDNPLRGFEKAVPVSGVKGPT
jgi:membrane-bound lytic murein transglycosylase D